MEELKKIFTYIEVQKHIAQDVLMERDNHSQNTIARVQGALGALNLLEIYVNSLILTRIEYGVCGGAENEK